LSRRPTILLQLEGAPVKAAASKDNMEFVINVNLLEAATASGDSATDSEDG